MREDLIFWLVEKNQQMRDSLLLFFSYHDLFLNAMESHENIDDLAHHRRVLRYQRVGYFKALPKPELSEGERYVLEASL